VDAAERRHPDRRPDVIAADHGVVLRAYKLRETSQIVCVLGLEQGRLRLVAHGSRGPRHKFGASLEPGSEIDLVFSRGPGRDLGTLREAVLKRSWLAGAARLDIMATGLAVLELVDQVLPEGAVDAGMTRDVLVTLESVARSPDRGGALGAFYRFELALLGRLGLEPALHACPVCGREAGAVPAVLKLREGALYCASCSSRGAGRLVLAADTAAVLAGLSRGEVPPAGPRTRRSIGLVLHRLLEVHVERYRYPRAMALLKKGDTAGPHPVDSDPISQIPRKG
jgi:DNA repair protein RecO